MQPAVPPFVNYDLIFNELRKGIRETPIDYSGCMLPATYAREFRTIKMRGSRQTGKTSFAVRKMIELNGVVIVRDESSQKAIFQTLDKRLHHRVRLERDFLSEDNEELIKILGSDTKEFFIDLDQAKADWVPFTLTELFGRDINITIL